MSKTSRSIGGSARGHVISVLLSAVLMISACSSTDSTADVSELEGRLGDLELLVGNWASQLNTLEVTPATEEDSSAFNDSTPSSTSIDSGEGTRNNPVPVGVTTEVGEGWTLQVKVVRHRAFRNQFWLAAGELGHSERFGDVDSPGECGHAFLHNDRFRFLGARVDCR